MAGLVDQYERMATDAPAAVNPVQLAKAIISGEDVDLAAASSMKPNAINMLEQRLGNLAVANAGFVDRAMDFLTTNPEQFQREVETANRREGTPDRSAGDYVRDYHAQHNKLQDPAMINTLADFADGKITRDQADTQLRSRLEEWETKIPQIMDQIRNPAAEPAPEPVQQRSEMRMGNSFG